MNWTFTDYIVGGSLLGITALLIFFAMRKIKNNTYKAVTILAVLVVLFLVWAELAVGIFGTPFAGS